jgi:uncharacterized protein
MAALFVDTAGGGNIVDPKQPFHQLATNIYKAARRASRRAITTNYIIAELEALLTNRTRVPRRTIVRFIENIKVSPFVRILHVDAALHEEAWRLLTSRSDKLWSLVDCSSFMLMTRLGLTEALTTDQHFEQAGFIRMLK